MDTLSGHYQAWSEAHTKYGHQFVTKDLFINRFSGISDHEMIDIINQESGQNINIESIYQNLKIVSFYLNESTDPNL